MRITSRFQPDREPEFFRPVIRHICERTTPAKPTRPEAPARDSSNNECPACGALVGIPGYCGVCEDTENMHREAAILGE